MSTQLQPYVHAELNFNESWVETILLQIGDVFGIEIVWNRDTTVLAGALAIAGGILGGYAGGRVGAALGAGIGGVTGIGVSTVISLRELWNTAKEKLNELLYIVFNYLRRLDTMDYVRAFEILMACTASRRELVYTIVEFIAHKLGTEVISNITTPRPIL